VARRPNKEESKGAKKRGAKKKTRAECHAKANKVLSKLLIISQMKKTKESAVNYVKALQEKMSTHPFITDKSSELKQALFDITSNKNLDDDMHHWAGHVANQL
jgi:hypothetical protein